MGYDGAAESRRLHATMLSPARPKITGADDGITHPHSARQHDSFKD